jgi:hypothetical protein
VLGLSAAIFLVAWVLTLVDMFRDMPEGFSTFAGASTSTYKLFGVHTAAVGALIGALLAAGAIKELAKAPAVAPPAVDAPPPAAPPPPPPPPPAG